MREVGVIKLQLPLFPRTTLGNSLVAHTHLLLIHLRKWINVRMALEAGDNAGLTAKNPNQSLCVVCFIKGNHACTPAAMYVHALLHVTAPVVAR